MNKELKEKIAVNAANEWCRCFKCDGRVNVTGCICKKDKLFVKKYAKKQTDLLFFDIIEEDGEYFLR